MKNAISIEDLQRENERLKEDLDFAQEKAESLKRELQAFVYAASHDLKESLRNISSYSQLLTRSGAHDESHEMYVGFILDGVRAATTLIEQLVTLSRAGGSAQRTTINLSACVAAAMYKLNDLIARRKARITYRDLPEVTVNQMDFEQVFERLIDNAIKYSGPNEPVIEIWAEETEEGHLISVKDNGPGIPEKFLSDIFQPFKRLHGREIPGAGVGLAFCRKILEAHDGRIWAESDGVNGVTFKIRLPY